MVEHINELLENNDVMVRINTNWFKLEELGQPSNKAFPILVSNEDGKEYTGYDMADIDEFDPMFDILKDVDTDNVGIA